MTIQNTILKYLEAAGKQNDDVIEFHQQDAMTLAMNLTNAVKAGLPAEEVVPDYLGGGNVDDYNNAGYAQGWNAYRETLTQPTVENKT